MTETLREKMEALRAVVPKLNKATDLATDVVRRVDEFLRRLSVGISAEVCYDVVTKQTADDHSQIDIERYIAYDRIEGKYQIHIIERQMMCEDNRLAEQVWEKLYDIWIPWSNCGRESKLQAFAKLPELLEVISSRAVELAESAEETAQAVFDMVGALPMPPAPHIDDDDSDA